MTHDQFFQSLKKGDVKGAYLLCGAEQYIKHSALQSLRKKLLPEGFEQLNEAVFEGAVSAQDIIDAGETLPLMGERRLVMVKDWPPLLPGKARSESDEGATMIKWLKALPPTCCLIFYVTDMPDARKKLMRELKDLVETVQFDPLSDAKIFAWCNQQLKKQGQRLSAEAAEQLVFMAGRALIALSHELDKLSAYVGDAAVIEAKDVEAVVTPSTECTVFQMIDCLMRGEGGRAQMLLKNMLDHGESRIGALAMITRQMRMLTHIRLMRGEGLTLAEIEKRLALSHYSAVRSAEQAGKFSVESLQREYMACVETDYAIKSGKMREEAALDLTMLRLLNMK